MEEKSSTPPMKAKAQKLATKVMAIAFFDRCGMVYCHVVPLGHTANAYYYKGVLEKLIRVHIPRKHRAQRNPPMKISWRE